MSYNLVINSKFRPFTYDEMVKPLAQYKEVYDKVEADYSTLLTQAEAWKDIANRENNPIAYDMYNRYINDLSAITDDLSRGLNPNNRSKLSTMRQRYSSDIIPIERAYTTRKKHIDEQKQARLKDPSLRFQRDASSTSLDTYIQNPDFEYGNSISGNALTKQVSDTVSHLAKQLRNYGNGKRIDNYTKTLFQQYGLTPQEVMEAQYNPNAANNMLVKIVNTVVDNSGVNEWNDSSARQWAYDYAARGLYSGIGQSGIKEYEDKGAIMATQHQYALDKMAKQHEYNMLELQAKAANSGKFGSKGSIQGMPRIPIGVSGKTNPDVERLAGLRPTTVGVASTTKLDNIGRELQKVNSKLEGLSKETIKQYEDYSAEQKVKKEQSYRSPGNPYGINRMPQSKSMSKPYGYDDYKDWLEQKNELDKQYKEEQSFIQSIINQYSSLGGSDYDKLLIASKLMDYNEKEQNSVFVFNGKPEEENALLNTIYSIVTSSEDVSTAGLFDKSGKKLSTDKAKALLSATGKDKPVINFLDNSKNVLQVTSGKDRYILKGETSIDRLGKTVFDTNNFLKGFSDKDLEKNVIDVTTEGNNNIMNNILTYGYIGNLNTTGIKPIRIGNDLQGITIKDGSEIFKIICDNQGNIVAMNTLSEELGNRLGRDAAVSNMILNGVSGIANMYVQDIIK